MIGVRIDDEVAAADIGNVPGQKTVLPYSKYS